MYSYEVNAVRRYAFCEKQKKIKTFLIWLFVLKSNKTKNKLH
jgi:hypothetical protein